MALGFRLDSFLFVCLCSELLIAVHLVPKRPELWYSGRQNLSGQSISLLFTLSAFQMRRGGDEGRLATYSPGTQTPVCQFDCCSDVLGL